MKKLKVTRSAYKKFVQGIGLKELKMTFIHAAVEASFMPPANLKIQDTASYEMKSANKIKVFHKYSIQGTKKGADKVGFSIEVRYILVYSTTMPMTNAIFNIFSKSSLRLHTWPYFRQYVHQLTLNMHLPPMILDTIKIPT